MGAIIYIVSPVRYVQTGIRGKSSLTFYLDLPYFVMCTALEVLQPIYSYIIYVAKYNDKP